MKNRELFKYAVDEFVELLQQVTARKIEYRCNDADVRAWVTFEREFGERVEREFIYRFTQYGIHSWFNESGKRDYSRSVRFSWIFGGQAIRRFKMLPEETTTWIVRKGLKSKYKIQRRHATALRQVVLSVRPVEEAYKGQFHNTARGVLWCRANTTLFYHRSKWCVTCDFAEECKSALRQVYPKVFKQRGYDEE